MVSKGLLRGYLFKGLVLSIVLCLLWLVQAPAQTRVGGIIAEDTTWEGEVFLEANTIVKAPCCSYHKAWHKNILPTSECLNHRSGGKDYSHRNP
ncbi:hypothetical protein DMNBHIDG_01729 [Candidatus Methanoperedenaceae archaeon GB37]|nr:hypothetical protein DMNBHIDG_01729 [Candidatus Methanoperedenaceae archaeon GB37]